MAAALPLLRSSRLIVIKIGSAVLADAASLCQPVLSSLASQIASLLKQDGKRRIIIVSSGAVAAGRAIVAQTERDISQSEKQALAAIGQARLMQAWGDAFAPFGIKVAQALLTREDFRSRERFRHITETINCLLSWDVVPIINENDTVAVHELKFGDNDTLASLLVNLVQADLYISLTSAPGVFASRPQEGISLPVLSSIENISTMDIPSLCGEKTNAGSGGMYSKLIAARRVAQLGVPTLILPGRVQNILLDAFAEDAERPGTLVFPQARPVSRRKFWLAYQSDPAGEIEIDSGAANALLSQGRSLLPGGITGVRGKFGKGSLIKIKYRDETLGVGISSYSSDDLLRIYGRKRHEIAALLGEANYPDAVHRDNLLLDAAV